MSSPPPINAAAQIKVNLELHPAFCACVLCILDIRPQQDIRRVGQC